MKQVFSRNWIRSKQPRKQRKYLANAPLHLRHKFFSTALSKELKKKYGRNSFPLRKGDKVKIMRGQFKKKEGKVVRINNKKIKTYIENIQLIKKDGSKVFYPIHPSNIIITELLLDDKKRKLALDRKKQNVTS